MTRLSTYWLPTIKEAPADAEAVSHKLLVRGGLVRQVGAGLWTYLPAGWRVQRRVEQVIREEIDRIGGQEMVMPVLLPAELWEASGRYEGIPELFKLDDRHGRPLVLAMTHEEVVAFHAARDIRSYRDLPKIVYHIQTKERDEARPRAGVLRTREFIMKDSYSLDRDMEGLDRAYELHIAAYDRIFDRCGLRWYRVESDVGMMGGLGAHEYMAPCPAGEDEIALSDAGYAANVAVATGIPRAPRFPDSLPAPEEVATPEARTIAAVSAQLELDEAAQIKAMPVTVEGEGVVLALVRGDHRLNDAKLHNALGIQARPATEEEIVAAFGAQPGSLGPVGARMRILADERLREGSFVSGANRTGYHLRGVEPGRDFQAEFFDLRSVEAGDACPNGGTIRLEPAIEVGNIFKLGTRYSEALGATYLDEQGTERHIVMGSYGIGPARIAAAAVEQYADEKGISWPRSIAPFDVHLVGLGKEGTPERELAERLYEDLRDEGLQALYDDRDASPGEKFADAELLGCPLRLTVGKRTIEAGAVEAQARRGLEQRSVPLEGAAAAARELWATLE